MPDENNVFQIQVNATSGPDGEDARGHFFAKYTFEGTVEYDVRGDVTCLRVVGNKAVVGGEIERGEGTDAVL